MKNKIAISACLAGIKCRYDGAHSLNDALLNKLDAEYITICPEVLGNLSTPRIPCEIAGGDGFDVLNGKARVLDKEGNDITIPFIQGAEKALKICLDNGIKKVYLKGKSPSCGCGKIYDGQFKKNLGIGYGVFAALLKQNNIEIIEVD